METRKIHISISDKNSYKTIDSNATTFGELKSELLSIGVDVNKYSFFEASSMEPYGDDSRALPEEVRDEFGRKTRDLAFVLALRNKNISSGRSKSSIMFDRLEAYDIIKSNNLESEFKNEIGRPMTSSSNDTIFEFLGKHGLSDKIEAFDSKTKERVYYKGQPVFNGSNDNTSEIANEDVCDEDKLEVEDGFHTEDDGFDSPTTQDISSEDDNKGEEGKNDDNKSEDNEEKLPYEAPRVSVVDATKLIPGSPSPITNDNICSKYETIIGRCDTIIEKIGKVTWELVKNEVSVTEIIEIINKMSDEDKAVIKESIEVSEKYVEGAYSEGYLKKRAALIAASRR